jgi:hypothetical protein
MEKYAKTVKLLKRNKQKLLDLADIRNKKEKIIIDLKKIGENRSLTSKEK